MKKKVMTLIDPTSGKMVCKVCGQAHWAQLKSGGTYKRGSWQCQNGCKLTARTLIKVEILQ